MGDAGSPRRRIYRRHDFVLPDVEGRRANDARASELNEGFVCPEEARLPVTHTNRHDCLYRGASFSASQSRDIDEVAGCCGYDREVGYGPMTGKRTPDNRDRRSHRRKAWRSG
jgi:hypothetical protein